MQCNVKTGNQIFIYIFRLLNQCWVIAGWITRSKLQWHLNQNTEIFIQEKAFENVVAKYRPCCVRLDVLKIFLSYFMASILPTLVGTPAARTMEKYGIVHMPR